MNLEANEREQDGAPPPGPRTWLRRRRTLVALLLFGALGITVGLLVVLRETDPYGGPRQAGRIGIEGFAYGFEQHNHLLTVLAAAVALALLGWAMAPRRLRDRRLLQWGGAILAVAITLLSGFAYLYGVRGIAYYHYPHFHDSFHYLLGAKYYDEVGYYSLYDCAIIADRQLRGELRPDTPIRNLRTYQLVPAGSRHGRYHCRDMFTPERWEEFKTDLGVFTSNYPLSELVRDHGYNGSPFLTWFSSGLVRLLPIDYSTLSLVALIDVAVILGSMVLVTSTFGWRIGLLFATLYFLNFSDRFVFIGGSYLRYVWFGALAAGIAMLKRGRYGWAGCLLTLSALLNVFPILFAVGPGLKALLGWAHNRALAPHYRRFVIAGLVTGVVGAGLGMAHGKGPSNYREFFSFVGGHADKLTFSRTGFRYDFLYRGETRGINVGYPQEEKTQELARLKPWVYALAGLILLVGFAVVLRLDDVEASALGGFLLFFFLFGTVEYYYAVTALLVLVWHRRLDARGGTLFVGLLFAVMTLAYLAWNETAFLQFCNNTVMSVALTSYLLGCVTYLGFESGVWGGAKGRLWRLFGRRTGPGLRRPRIEALAVTVALAVTPLVVFGGWALFGG